MDIEVLKSSIEEYEKQLAQVNSAIANANDGPDKTDLLSLQNDLLQLIQLSNENLKKLLKKLSKNDLDDEYALFKAEMEKEGALENDVNEESLNEDLKSLEGMKCRAPFQHSWGDKVYHNAMICSSVTCETSTTFEEINVRVMFTNPTHQEMLPCPYFLNTECKFSEDKCRFSHGEVVPFSCLQEYIEPDFSSLKIGSKVLAKQSTGLWLRATVKMIFEEKCLIAFESNRKHVEIELKEVFPLMSEAIDSKSDSSDNENSEDDQLADEVEEIQYIDPKSSEKLGEWEKYTKGIGSKLMQQMGYIVGTGLGKQGEGRIEPVPAVILPSGKSLDHCMELRENAGGDKNLFSVERRLKRLAKKQENTNKKVYDDMKKKESQNVFMFLNETLSKPKSILEAGPSKSVHRQQIKAESNRDLNIASLKVEEEAKRLEKELFIIKKSLNQHSDPNSQMNKNLLAKLRAKENELVIMRSKAVNIKNEQCIRSDKKKLTLF